MPVASLVEPTDIPTYDDLLSCWSLTHTRLRRILMETKVFQATKESHNKCKSVAFWLEIISYLVSFSLIIIFLTHHRPILQNGFFELVQIYIHLYCLTSFISVL